MSHEPSRTPLRAPLVAGALSCFTHPRCRVLGRVVRHPQTKAVMVANGCVALRVTRGPIEFDDEIPEACAAFVKRVDGLPWGRFDEEHLSKRMTPPVFKPLGMVTGNLYQYGLEELWSKTGRMTMDKAVWVAESMLVPLAVLQLVARLPAVALRMDAASDFLLITFAGGEGIIANRWGKVAGADLPAPIFSIFKGRDRMQGGLSKF